MRRRLAALAALAASPARAATEEAFFTFHNAEFVVLISFLLFLAVLGYYKVPRLLGGMLDKRAGEIRAELDEARRIREEAQDVLASYERRQQEVGAQTERITAHAREEARNAADEAKKNITASIDRRLRAAEDRIASAEAAAVREVRDRAVEVAIDAARDVIAERMTAEESDRLIERSIDEAGKRLH